MFNSSISDFEIYVCFHYVLMPLIRERFIKKKKQKLSETDLQDFTLSMCNTWVFSMIFSKDNLVENCYCQVCKRMV